MLTIRQRLKLGLTVANITEIAKTLKAEGEIGNCGGNRCSSGNEKLGRVCSGWP
jgi:hypothetical protein